MQMIDVSVRWGSQVLNVNLCVDSTLEQLRNALYAETGVPPEKQTLMLMSKKLLKSTQGTETLSSLGIIQAPKLMLIGTAQGRELKAPSEKVVFLEDLSVQQKAVLKALPPGLLNLGDTCYLNSVIQFLRRARGFSAAVAKLPGVIDLDVPNLSFTASFRELFKCLDTSTGPVAPLNVLDWLRRLFPNFATMAENGVGYAQQDAEECLSSILEELFRHVDDIKKLFELSLRVSTKCEQIEGDPPEVYTEKAKMLKCHLGSSLEPVGHLRDGMLRSLIPVVEKHSELLGKTVKFTQKSEILTLPDYVIVHIVRFEWKAPNVLARTKATRAKIVRKVTFPNTLDLFEFCTPELQKSITPAREILRPTTDDTGEENSGTNEKSAASSTGIYKLCSIVTHQGRTADSGHYIGWVSSSQAKGEKWMKMDDDKISEVDFQKMDLQGGRSDHHIAILLLYEHNKVILPENLKNAD